MTFQMEHVGGCNALCDSDRHYLIAEPVDPTAAKPLGDGWTEVGYIEDSGVASRFFSR